MTSDSHDAEVAVPNWEEVCAKIERRDHDLQQCEEWFENLVIWVHRHLTKYLQEISPAGKFTFEGTLEEQEPLDIEKSLAGGKFSTIKESWNWPNALKSLGETGMYEAPGSIFWLNKKGQHGRASHWRHHILIIPRWGQVGRFGAWTRTTGPLSRGIGGDILGVA